MYTFRKLGTILESMLRMPKILSQYVFTSTSHNNSYAITVLAMSYVTP